ncbi:MAG TPA: HAD family hydrolase [bacterium]|nr:HAD family hydrolase [bacterium]
MRKIDLFLFDLDGTLIDSKRDIAASVNFTMAKLGLPRLPDDLIYSFVGHGVTPLIRQTVEAAGGSAAGGFDQAMAIFKAHYDQHLLDTTEAFPGVREVLKHFLGKKKIVLTNKSQGFSDKILKGLALSPSFDGVFGGDTEFPKKPAPDVVHHLLKTYGVSPKHAVIVGDSRVDMETGTNAGILRCGVTYGFRPRAELEDAGFDYMIERPEELLSLFD